MSAPVTAHGARPVYDLGVATATWLPPSLEGRVDGVWREVRREARGLAVTVRTFFPSPAGLATLETHLRAASARLRATPVDELATIFDRLADQWLTVDDPTRVETIPRVAAATGFSPEMVAHAIDLEQESSRRDHLLRAVLQELVDPGMLDELTPNGLLMGQSRVVGPELVGAVFSANIPGLPHLEVMRAMLVKSSVLGKVPAGEPVFLGAYAHTLAAEAPELGECLAVVGVDRDDEAARRAFASAVDHLVAYGGPDAIATWRAACPPDVPATLHGHRLGFAVVLREALDGGPAALDALARALAYDFSLFDQEACLAPAALYVERGGAATPRDLAARIAACMRDEARDRPPRELTLAEAAARRAFVDAAVLDGLDVVDAPRALPWLVLVDSAAPLPALSPTPPGRSVRVVPIDDALDLPASLRGYRRLLQGAAIAGGGDRRRALGNGLALAGVTRLTLPGLMGTPSMMWRHDGVPCLAHLVRWCDEELLAPRDNRMGAG